MIHASFKARDERLVKPVHDTHYEEGQAYLAAHQALMEEFGDALAAEYLSKISEGAIDQVSAEVYSAALNFTRSSADFEQIERTYIVLAGLAELTAVEVTEALPQAPVDLVDEFLKDAEAKGKYYEPGTFNWGFYLQGFLNDKLNSGEWVEERSYFKKK